MATGVGGRTKRRRRREREGRIMLEAAGGVENTESGESVLPMTRLMVLPRRHCLAACVQECRGREARNVRKEHGWRPLCAAAFLPSP